TDHTSWSLGRSGRCEMSQSDANENPYEGFEKIVLEGPEEKTAGFVRTLDSAKLTWARSTRQDARDNHSGDTERLYLVGEAPGIGRYVCVSCKWVRVLGTESANLQPCERCGISGLAKYRVSPLGPE